MLQQTKQCEICGKMSSIGEPIDPHHVIHKSQGGTDHDHNVQMTCRTCHDGLHGQLAGGAWVIVERSASRLLVMQGDEIIVDILYPPQEWDQGQYLFLIQQMEGFLEQATAQAQWLDNDGLVAAAEVTIGMGKGIWIFQAELIYLSMRRIPRGSRVEKLNAIAEKMGIKQSYAYDLLHIRESFPEIVSDDRKLPQGMYRVAAKTTDSAAALDMAEERLAEDPRYTVERFQQEVKGGMACGWNHQGKCAFIENKRCLECPDRTVR